MVESKQVILHYLGKSLNINNMERIVTGRELMTFSTQPVLETLCAESIKTLHIICSESIDAGANKGLFMYIPGYQIKAIKDFFDWKFVLSAWMFGCKVTVHPMVFKYYPAYKEMLSSKEAMFKRFKETREVFLKVISEMEDDSIQGDE